MVPVRAKCKLSSKPLHIQTKPKLQADGTQTAKTLRPPDGETSPLQISNQTTNSDIPMNTDPNATPPVPTPPPAPAPPAASPPAAQQPPMQNQQQQRPRDDRRGPPRDDRPYDQRPQPTAAEIAREYDLIQQRREQQQRPAAPAASGWFPAWFRSSLLILVLIILGLVAIKVMMPTGGNTGSGIISSGSGFAPIPEAERHPALRDAFDASRVHNTKAGVALSNFPPAVVEKIRGGARAVHVLSTNKVWSLYPPPYSKETTAVIP